MDRMQKKLKTARAEIEAVMKKHNIAGYVSLHAPGWGEAFWNIWPSYSVLHGEFPSIRIKSKLVDYGNDADKQRADQAHTAEMAHSLGTTMGSHAMMFLELANVLNAKFGVEHVDKGFEPDPSKSNPAAH